MGAGSEFRYGAISSMGSAYAFLCFQNGTEAEFVTVYSIHVDRDMKVRVLCSSRLVSELLGVIILP